MEQGMHDPGGHFHWGLGPNSHLKVIGQLACGAPLPAAANHRDAPQNGAPGPKEIGVSRNAGRSAIGGSLNSVDSPRVGDFSR